MDRGGVNPFNLINPSTPITVTAGNQDKNITAYVVDATTTCGRSWKRCDYHNHSTMAMEV